MDVGFVVLPVRPSTSIHIGLAVSFTLGWVGDVSRIMQYIVLFGTFS